MFPTMTSKPAVGLVLLVLAVVTACTVALAPASASSSSPAAVTINIHPTVFGPDQVGTWNASGAVNDSGSYARTDGNGTGSIPECFCDPTHIGAFQETFTLSGASGTLVVKAEHRLIPNGGQFGDTRGVWQVVSGTGSYARISAHGADVWDVSTLTLVLTGVVSKTS